MSVLTHRMPCKNRHEKNVPKHKKCSGTFSFIVREILIYLAPSHSSFVTAHNRKLIRSSAQDGRKMVAKPKKMGHRFYRYPIDFIVVRPAGIEPAAYCLGGRLYWRCHNLLQLLSRYIVVVDTVCDVARRDKDISLWSQNGRKGEYREGQEYGYSEKSHTLHRCAGQRE